MLFWRSHPMQVPSSTLRGVNLGGWLALEKWITPSLFKGTTAGDEYTLSTDISKSLKKRLAQHRDTFITKDDFMTLKEHGIDAVRLPVGYGVFGDQPPYIGAIEYVDEAFALAQESGIKILLDLHGAPGSQNGAAHSGRSGASTWHKDEANTITTLQVISRLAKRYAGHPSLLGIELLNEPKSSIPKRALLRYYEAAYDIIRDNCGEGVWVVFSDGFRPRRWRRALRGAEYKNVYIDTHQYQNFSKYDKKLDIAGHLKKTMHKVPKLLRKMRKYHPLIVGEWSLALDAKSLVGLDADQIKAARRAYGAAQLLAYRNADAWFYWTYKTEGGGVWSYRDCVNYGWLPDNTK